MPYLHAYLPQQKYKFHGTFHRLVDSIKIDKGTFNNYVDRILPFFDHSPPFSVDSFFTLSVGKKNTFFDPLPPSSCPRSYWMPTKEWLLRNHFLTPNKPLIHTSFAYSKLNMDDSSILTGLLGYLDSTQEVELKSLQAQTMSFLLLNLYFLSKFILSMR